MLWEYVVTIVMSIFGYGAMIFLSTLAMLNELRCYARF